MTTTKRDWTRFNYKMEAVVDHRTKGKAPSALKEVDNHDAALSQSSEAPKKVDNDIEIVE